MEGTLGETALPLWWQVAKIVLFLTAGYLAVRFLSKFLFPHGRDEASPEDTRPPDEWLKGRRVEPEGLEKGNLLVRDDDVWFEFLRKAEPDEFREGVEEWLFHPPGNPDDLWIGLTREQIGELRLVDDSTQILQLGV